MLAIACLLFFFITGLVAWPASSDRARKPYEGMVKIPAGKFLMGCHPKTDKSCEPDEPIDRDVKLPDFWMDRTEVTVAEYARCVRAKTCSRPKKGPYCNWQKKARASHPVNCVSWKQAQAYCQWAGKRLPTEAEWEKAARGADGRTYPWGEEPPSCTLAVMNDGGEGCGRTGTRPVCSKSSGNSPYGMCDMGGNVWEWVSEWYTVEKTELPWPYNNPVSEPSGKYRILRGGSWANTKSSLRTAARYGLPPGYDLNGLGFRCVVDSIEK
jgi:formylglycine-generating enzyme required for sulfatase activity